MARVPPSATVDPSTVMLVSAVLEDSPGTKMSRSYVAKLPFGAVTVTITVLAPRCRSVFPVTVKVEDSSAVTTNTATEVASLAVF